MSGGMRFTPEQRQAIELRGGSLLVSAAAGSGKTKVLVERLLGELTDPDRPCLVTDFLIITYTKAAAAELRGKITDAIAARLAEDPGNRFLRRQLSLCACAEIGTIHSFCTRVIRENAHVLGLQPDFRVADENESALIRERVLERVLDQRYERLEELPDFSVLVDAMAAGRDDARLAEITLDIHARLQSFPYPEKWRDRQLEMLELEDAEDAGQTVWGAYLLERARRAAGYWLERLDALIGEAEGDGEFFDKYGPSLLEYRAGAAAFLAAAGRGWDAAAAAAAFGCVRPRPAKGRDDLKAEWKKCRAGMEKTVRVFDCTSDRALGDLRAAAPAVRELLRLVFDFDAAYAAEKRRRGAVDFADLEHFAVRILTDPETGAPSEAARMYARRYREVLVDEYQDVNEVQDAIFRAVSREEQNLFLVGDVKQSIYRFRLADPTIFLREEARCRAGQGGTCVTLSTNFRSRAGVLEAVNDVFSACMSAEFGEMDYTEREKLHPGAVYPAAEGMAPELDILDAAAGDGDDAPDKTELEADFVAARILELRETLRVSDGQGGTRPARFGDFTVLMRSPRSRQAVYTRALARRGIPAGLDQGSSFFETPEIAFMVSLLTVIDNPRQDIPLAAVLRSPVFGFTLDELGQIRLCAPEEDFFSALRRAAEHMDKARVFLALLDRLRARAEDRPADRLIWEIYDETGALGVFSAMPGGEARRANLLGLAETARSYEQSGYKGLYLFVGYLRERMEQGDASADAPAPARPDAVRITSIHRSKGLEYPVVFLADLAHRFNKADSMKPLLFHPALGVGPKVTNRALSAQYPTIARDAAAARSESEMLAEELRVLYVGMTRAKEKLVMTCAFPEAAKKLARLRADAGSPVPPQTMESAASPAEWILLSALARPEAAALFGEETGPLPAQAWDMRLVRPAGGAPSAVPAESAAADAPEPEEDLHIAAKLAFRYPYERAVRIPSKLTATELKGRQTDAEAAEEAEPAFPRSERPEFRRPDFAAERSRMTAAERGTAVHLALQYIDPAAARMPDGVRRELRRLLDEGVLTARTCGAVDALWLERFYGSDLGRRAAASPLVRREFKFSLLTDAGAYFPGGEGEQILLQGVVDCCFEEGDGLVLLDFKTDRVRPGGEAAAGERYRGQLDAYALALERMTGKPVREKALFFLRTGKTVRL